MVGIGRKLDQASRGELVHHTLDGLSREAHIARNVRHGQSMARQGDRAKHLPACAGEPDVSDQPVARREEPTIEPKDLEHQLGEGLGTSHCRFCGHIAYAST